MIKIIADIRESRIIILELRKLGAEVIEETITPGDYVVGEEFGIERKTITDFIKSIYDKRLFEQIERLSDTYSRCCLLVEGDASRTSYLSNPLVFWGALSKIITEYNIPVVFTYNEKQSAQFLFSMGKKLQEKRKKEIKSRYKPKMYSLRYKQLFVVQGLPSVGPKLADRLLRTFGSVRAVFTASEAMLSRVKGVGNRKAKKITELLDAPYGEQLRLE